MSERKSKPISTKVPVETCNAIKRVVRKYGISQSDFLKIAAMGLLSQLDTDHDYDVIDELTVEILKVHMDMCPVVRSLRAHGKPRDTPASNEEEVKGP